MQHKIMIGVAGCLTLLSVLGLCGLAGAAIPTEFHAASLVLAIVTGALAWENHEKSTRENRSATSRRRP